MIWLLLFLAVLQAREFPSTQVGITRLARAELVGLYDDWTRGGDQAACLLGHVTEGAAIEIVMGTGDLGQCRHERVLGGAFFMQPVAGDETIKGIACSLLEHRLDWYITLVLTGVADDELFICVRLAEGAGGEQDRRIGGSD
jgi:hypothetical protein